jgi:hypothetical protein
MKTNIINATGHDIHLLNNTNEVIHTFPVTNLRPRVNQKSELARIIGGFDITREVFTGLDGLPNESEGTFYIVSVICAQAGAKLGRNDLLVVGPTVRETLPDGKSVIKGCRNLATL